VVTAHYDHVGIGRADAKGDSIFNGADDNASGTAALLVLAEYFSKNRPQHGMLFVALDAEEMGLRGARALVNDFPYPLEQIQLNLNMDMLSRSDKNELYVSGTHYYPQFKRILEKVANGSNPSLLFGHDVPGTGREDWTRSSDHGAFFEKKVPHLYFGVEDHVDYHKPSDEFKTIQQQFYSRAVNLVLKSLLTLDKELVE
jgi:Zn-dependent M28 family amino/carboxypeptidase